MYIAGDPVFLIQLTGDPEIRDGINWLSPSDAVSICVGLIMTGIWQVGSD